MGTDLVILFEPSVDDSSGLIDRDKPLRIENFSAERSIEPLIVPILPR